MNAPATMWPPELARPAVVFADEKLRIASYEDLLVLRWMDSPGVVHFEAALRTARKAAERGRLGLLSVADAPSKRPHLTVEEAAAGKRMSEGFQNVTKAVAHVILMDGFVGASARMIISTLILVRRSGSPNKVFSTLEEGQRWLAPFLSSPAVADRALEIFASLC
jgi:hypothetical protein